MLTQNIRKKPKQKLEKTKKMRSRLALSLILVLLLTPPPSESLSYSTLHTLHSLSHSLLLRVSNLRLTRGDRVGSDRARFVATKLDRAMGLGLWRSVLSLGWDYLRNYAWRDTTVSSYEVVGAVKDLNELVGALTELTRMKNDGERVEWVKRNYRNALRACNSLFRRLLRVFHHSGPLKQLVETVQKEVVEGDLLRDCLELGSNDLNGLIQIMKDVALQFSSNSDSSDL